jgi:hypothetical protein
MLQLSNQTEFIKYIANDYPTKGKFLRVEEQLSYSSSPSSSPTSCSNIKKSSNNDYEIYNKNMLTVYDLKIRLNLHQLKT